MNNRQLKDEPMIKNEETINDGQWTRDCGRWVDGQWSMVNGRKIHKASFLYHHQKKSFMQNQSFQFMLGGTPYEVKAVPFKFNEGTRYTVTINGSGEYVFAYDSNVGQYVPLDDDSSTIPQVVETEIAGRLLAMAG